MTVARAFDDLRRSLELTQDERSKADAQQKVVRETFGNVETFLTGSFARGTAIRPLHDVDLFVVLAQPVSHDPSKVLGDVHGVLARKFPNTRIIHPQNRSVHIEFSGSGIEFDVVPAHKVGDVYMIPDRERNHWIRTNPRLHEEKAICANRQCGDKLKPLIKMAKHWNRRAGGQGQKLMSSFLLEVMAWEFKDTPSSYARGLVELFAFLAGRVQSPVPDPAGVGPRIDEGMDQAARTRIARALDDAANEGQRALTEASVGNTSAAHVIWTRLLGDVYRPWT